MEIKRVVYDEARIREEISVMDPREDPRSGQTLIETLVAIFILVMGVTAAVGLAIYSFNSSTGITKQIIATGLAREGIEAVKNMRDTNWLQQTTIDTNCYNYSGATLDAKCYKNWLNQKYCIDPTNNSGHGNSNCTGTFTTMSYNLGIDVSDPDFWVLERQNITNNYGLDSNSNLSNFGFYKASNSANGSADYYRKIVIEKDTTAPFQADPNGVGPRLKVKSQVWWVDKKCPRVPDYTAGMKCSLEIDTNLTNWKDY